MLRASTPLLASIFQGTNTAKCLELQVKSGTDVFLMKAVVLPSLLHY